jgi:hypothetical protein
MRGSRPRGLARLSSQRMICDKDDRSWAGRDSGRIVVPYAEVAFSIFSFLC